MRVDRAAALTAAALILSRPCRATRVVAAAAFVSVSCASERPAGAAHSGSGQRRGRGAGAGARIIQSALSGELSTGSRWLVSVHQVRENPFRA